MNWKAKVKKELQRLGLTWEEVEAATPNRRKWRQSVAVCNYMEVG